MKNFQSVGQIFIFIFFAQGKKKKSKGLNVCTKAQAIPEVPLELPTSPD